MLELGITRSRIPAWHELIDLMTPAASDALSRLRQLTGYSFDEKGPNPLTSFPFSIGMIIWRVKQSIDLKWRVPGNTDSFDWFMLDMPIHTNNKRIERNRCTVRLLGVY
jgi:hypothetical protein